MPKVRLEQATPGLQTQCCSNWPIQLKSYCWELVEFIQLVYCIIIYLSFLNCDWLLIGQVQSFYWTQKLLVPVQKFMVRVLEVRLELASPGLKNSVLWRLRFTAHKLLLRISWVYQAGVLHHYILIISQLWLTSHQRSTVVLLDTETPGSNGEIYSEDDEGEILTGNPWITNPKSGNWEIQLISYYRELVEFIQLVYCIIIYLSFLNCDWLLIREVQWFYWTQETNGTSREI